MLKAPRSTYSSSCVFNSFAKASSDRALLRTALGKLFQTCSAPVFHFIEMSWHWVSWQYLNVQSTHLPHTHTHWVERAWLQVMVAFICWFDLLVVCHFSRCNGVVTEWKWRGNRGNWCYSYGEKCWEGWSVIFWVAESIGSRIFWKGKTDNVHYIIWMS